MAFVATRTKPQELWRKSGDSLDRPDAGVPSLSIVPAVTSPAMPETARGRPLAIRWSQRLRGALDRLIASGSLVANDPVLDLRDFAWTEPLRANWRAIRDEALQVALRHEGDAAMWQSVVLWGWRYPVEENLARCPCTAGLVRQIPGLDTAVFSILAPGTHIPAHRGVTKGLITCQLGLIVPADGDVRMRVGDRVVRWAEGETLVFDDSYDHEVWNDTAGTRVVLLVRFERPLRQPAKLFADLLLTVVRRSALVREARADAGKRTEARRHLEI